MDFAIRNRVNRFQKRKCCHNVSLKFYNPALKQLSFFADIIKAAYFFNHNTKCKLWYEMPTWHDPEWNHVMPYVFVFTEYADSLGNTRAFKICRIKEVNWVLNVISCFNDTCITVCMHNYDAKDFGPMGFKCGRGYPTQRTINMWPTQYAAS